MVPSTRAGSATSLRERGSSLAILLVLVVGVTLLGSAGSTVIDITVIGMLINIVLVVALYVFVGNSGVFSFGHIAFMAIGAYTAGIVRMPELSKDMLLPALPHIQLGPLPATIAGGLASALVALAIGFPLMRLSGLVAALGTFALLNIVNVVAKNLDSITGGSTGLAGIPATTTVTSALIWALLAIAAAWAFQQTRYCLRLRAAREDEVAALATGIGVRNERMVAFVLSAFLTGLAGGLYAQFFGSFNPDAFFLTVTFTTVAMLVVGGRLSLSGAVVGAVFLTWVRELLRQAEQGVTLGPIDIPGRAGLQEVGVALAMLVVLLLRPNGLLNGKELTFDARRLRRPRARRPQESEEVA
jgi:branched-chain amino acid transport system permease protein